MKCGPTACRSAAASACDSCQKANDLAREAVSCNGGLGGWSPTLVCSRHDRSTPAQYHAGITSAHQNHVQHTIRLSTTSNPHHEPSNHTCTTGTCTTSLVHHAF